MTTITFKFNFIREDKSVRYMKSNYLLKGSKYSLLENPWYIPRTLFRHCKQTYNADNNNILVIEVECTYI